MRAGAGIVGECRERGLKREKNLVDLNARRPKRSRSLALVRHPMEMSMQMSGLYMRYIYAESLLLDKSSKNQI